MTRLDQLRSELLSLAHRRQIYYSRDLSEADRICRRARELNFVAIRYLLNLERFEPRPKDGSPYKQPYDMMIAALAEVVPILEKMAPEAERSREKSDD